MKPTQRQERIANGCGLIMKEIAVKNLWGTQLAKNLLKRLEDLITQELNNEPEAEEDLVALQEKINDQKN